MSTIPQSTNQIDDVLHRLEASEQSKRRRQSVRLLIILLLITGMGVGAFVFLRQTPGSLEVYGLGTLDSTSLATALQSDAAAILVNHPDLGTETIRSMEDYAALIRITEALSLIESEEDSPIADTLEWLPVFSLDISGKREAKELLVFTIEKYDPAISYLLDFGNGVKRIVNRQTVYRYPRPGNFEVKLLATKDSARSIYKKAFSIFPAQEQAPVADQAPPDRIAEGADQEPSEVRPIQEADPSLFSANEPEASLPVELPAENLWASNEPGISPIIRDIEPRGTRLRNVDPQEPAPLSSSVVNRVYAVEELDEVPQFAGGEAQLKSYLSKVEYPRQIRDAMIQGRVVASFVILPNGKVTQIKIRRSLEASCDQAVREAIQAMPLWRPGVISDVAVATFYSVAVDFDLEK